MVYFCIFKYILIFIDMTSRPYCIFNEFRNISKNVSAIKHLYQKVVFEGSIAFR